MRTNFIAPCFIMAKLSDAVADICIYLDCTAQKKRITCAAIKHKTVFWQWLKNGWLFYRIATTS